MLKKLHTFLDKWQVFEYFYLKLLIYAGTAIACIVAMLMAISSATSP